jgi:hypothetical protein
MLARVGGVFTAFICRNVFSPFRYGAVAPMAGPAS